MDFLGAKFAEISAEKRCYKKVKLAVAASVVSNVE